MTTLNQAHDKQPSTEILITHEFVAVDGLSKR